MTTKSEKRTPREGAAEAGIPREEMQTAYQIHTLAQILYGQLQATHPWTHVATPTQTYGAFQGFLPTQAYGPMQAMHGYGPMAGWDPTYAPWAGGWGAQAWGGPAIHHTPPLPFMTGFGPFPR